MATTFFMSIVLDLHSQLLQQDFYSHTGAGERHTEVPLVATSVSMVQLNGIIYHRDQQGAKQLPDDYGSLILLKQGSGWWLTEQTTVSASNSQLVFIAAGEPHVFHHPEQYQAISFNFPINWLQSHTGVHLHHGQTLAISMDLLSLLLSVLHSKSLGKTDRVVLEQKIVHSLTPQLLRSIQPKPLIELQHLMHQHACNEEFTIAALADYSGWSKRYIHKLFSDAETSAAEYLIQLKLRHAYFELLKGQTSLNQVAINAGFKTQAHFSRRFKQLFQLSPKEISRRVHA